MSAYSDYAKILDGFDALEPTTKRLRVLIHAAIEYQGECTCEEHEYASTLLSLAEELAIRAEEQLEALSAAVLPDTPPQEEQEG